MGTVWLAERTDMLQKRPVALKLPRAAWRGARLAERLAREREILAPLNHPNIARLYDAGVATDGQPYLALEYVEGERIDAYCLRKQLDVPARLRLFLQVARAVAHAHANLVVHRDLKPTNILVTESGEVKLLDFGIAKLLEQGDARQTELTQLGGRALTPDYASPEQILGHPLATSADVYSLGVVLYELLTGTRPYKLKRDSRAALEEAIVQAEPAMPSSVASDAAIARRLRGDLDTILLKALKKLPAQRYATVDALAEDIERHLSHRAVLAQPDGRIYRLRKFIARNKLAVGATASVLAAIVAGAGVAVWQARVAVLEKQRAENVKEFIASIFSEANPFAQSGDKPITAADLLRNARERIDRELATNPPARAELLTVVGTSLSGLGDYKRASEVLDEAVRAWQGVAPEHDPRVVRAQIHLADAEHQLGRVEPARARLAQVEALLGASGQAESEEFARLKVTEATFEFNEGRFKSDKAFAAAQAAARVAPRAAGENGEVTIAAHNSLSVAYRWRGQLDLARQHAEKAYRLALVRFGTDGRHPRTIQLESEYGRILGLTGDLANAVRHMGAAAARAEESYGANHVMVQHFKGTLAIVQLDNGDVRAAIKNLSEAVGQDVGAAKLSPSYRASRAVAQGRAWLAARRPADALPYYEDALAVLAQSKTRGPVALQGEVEHALVLAQLGRADSAALQLETIVAARRKADTEELQPALRALSQARAAQGRFADALQLATEAATMLEVLVARPTARAAHKVAFADTLRDIGLMRLELHQPQDALRDLERARQRYADTQGTLAPGHVEALVGLGRTHLRLGQPAAALPFLERADAFWRDFDPGNRWAGDSAFWLAQCLEALDRKPEARASYRRAADLLARSPLAADTKRVQVAQKAL
jgi:serine/threonine-protein kinase